MERAELSMNIWEVKAPDIYVLMTHTVIALFKKKTTFSMKFLVIVWSQIPCQFLKQLKIGPEIIGLILNGSSVKASS